MEDCLQHLLTTHEDVELGRCIRKHVGVACTWNYEMQKLFHNNQSTAKVLFICLIRIYISKAYTGDLSEVKAAITVHPVKDPAVMRRVHAHNRAFKLKEMRAARALLRDELSYTRPAKLTRSIPNKWVLLLHVQASFRTAEIVPWEYINSNKIIFCADKVNCPRHTVDLSIRTEMADIITQVDI